MPREYFVTWWWPDRPPDSYVVTCWNRLQAALWAMSEPGFSRIELFDLHAGTSTFIEARP